MTTTKSILIPIQITPGVQPATDKTNFATTHYTQADKIRFRFGFPQKIGGWVSVLLNYGSVISGLARSLFSAILSTSVTTIIGTNSNLYSISGSILTNITPLQVSTIALGSNPISTNVVNLSSNPIATVSGSNIITVNDPLASILIPGNLVTFSSLTATNGLGTGVLNAAHVVHTIVDSSHYTVIVSAAATSTGSGGGASGTAANNLLTINKTAHGMLVGQRVKIVGATATGGILAANINSEFNILFVSANQFVVASTTVATSQVLGGGSSVTYQPQITSGAANQGSGQGYGAGFYGVSLYGTALPSSTGIVYPRIWFFDRYGSNIILTAGNQTGLYTWTGSNTTAPVLVANAPAAINYSFVSNNIAVTFGASGIPNRIFASDQGNITQWISSSSNQVFDDTVVGAGQFLSHVPVGSNNLIFTKNQTYLFSYINFVAGQANAVWNIQLLENNIGIIASMARCSVAGVAFWMGQNNFYMWASGNVAIIPANDQAQSTLLNYVFTNINRGQSSKCFAWYNEQFDEIWFHYPSASSNECDSIAKLNRTDLTWTPDTFDRTCAEYPNLSLSYPRLVSAEGVLYEHEQGVDADGQPMPFSLTTNLRGGDFIKNYLGASTTKTYMLTGIVPDSQQTGDITLEVMAQKFPQSPELTADNDYTITPTTELIPMSVGGRLWKYKVSGEALGQEWTAGQWQAYAQESAMQ